jgi:hypothetical protein
MALARADVDPGPPLMARRVAQSTYGSWTDIELLRHSARDPEAFGGFL